MVLPREGTRWHSDCRTIQVQDDRHHGDRQHQVRSTRDALPCPAHLRPRPEGSNASIIAPAALWRVGFLCPCVFLATGMWQYCHRGGVLTAALRVTGASVTDRRRWWQWWEWRQWWQGLYSLDSRHHWLIGLAVLGGCHQRRSEPWEKGQRWCRCGTPSHYGHYYEFHDTGLHVVYSTHGWSNLTLKLRWPARSKPRATPLTRSYGSLPTDLTSRGENQVLGGMHTLRVPVMTREPAGLTQRLWYVWWTGDWTNTIYHKQTTGYPL